MSDTRLSRRTFIGSATAVAVLGAAGLVRLLTFYDPDDNALMLYEDLQGG